MNTASMAKGTFTLARIAKNAAKRLCNGIGNIMEKNIPIAKPCETVARHGFHNRRFRKRCEIKEKKRLLRIRGCRNCR
jgi:hypothetical protein